MTIPAILHRAYRRLRKHLLDHLTHRWKLHVGAVSAFAALDGVGTPAGHAVLMAGVVASLSSAVIRRFRRSAPTPTVQP